MNYTMHNVIRGLLAGKEVIEPAWFGDDEDLSAYECYIPALCELLKTEKRGLGLFSPAMILMEIMPADPDPSIFSKLIEQLPASKANGIGILKILSNYSIPQQVDIQLVIDLIGADYFSATAILALRKTYHPDVEQKVLPLLREELSGDLDLLKVYCETLAINGSILSIPVLMAISQDFNQANQKQCFMDAISAICTKLKLPQDIREQFEDAGFWKLKWGGSPEQFVGFIEFIALFMVSGQVSEGSKEDQIANIFMQEMDVDLAPYASFEAARVCSSPDNMLAGLQNLKDNLECNLLLNAVTEGTDVLPSTYTMAKDLYFDLMNDYLMTRLRRHISFAKD